MNVGLQILTDTDNLVIDSHYHNLGLSQKIKKSNMQNLGATNYNRPEYGEKLNSKNYRTFPTEPMVRYRYEIPAHISFPVVAMDAFSGFNFCGGVFTSGSSKYLEIYTNNPNDFNIYIYSTQNSNRSKVGLEVYNEKGETVFDSEHGYLKMLDRIDPNKRCGVVLLGAIVAEVSIVYLHGYQHYLRAFRIENNVLKPIRVFHLIFKAKRRSDQHIGAIQYDNTPYIIDVSHH